MAEASSQEDLTQQAVGEGPESDSQVAADPPPLSIPIATYQAFEQRAHSERFLIRFLGLQFRGGMAAVYSQFNFSDPDVLSQMMDALEKQGKDVSNPLSLFGNDVDNATSEMKKALQEALQWSQGNDDQVNVSKSGQVEKRPVLQVLGSRAPRNILAQDAQKLQNLFLAVFENPSEVNLSAPNAFDVWYSKINQSGIPEVQLHCERIPAAAMQSGDLSQQSALPAQARPGFVGSVAIAEGKMWKAFGQSALVCAAAGVGVIAAAATGGLSVPIVGVLSMAPFATTAFQVSGLVLAATATGTAATTALSAGIGVVQAVGDVGKPVVSALPGAYESARNGCQYVAGLFNRQHEAGYAR
jgi:hypothetical protein